MCGDTALVLNYNPVYCFYDGLVSLSSMGGRSSNFTNKLHI